MIAKTVDFVKNNLGDILYLLVILLLIALSFSLGYITAKIEEKEPLEYEKRSSTIILPENKEYYLSIESNWQQERIGEIGL